MPSIILDMQTLDIGVAIQAANNLLGYSANELLGKPLTALIPAEDHAALMQANRDPVPEGQTQWRCMNKDGRIVHVQVKYRETMFRGRPARFVIVVESSTSQS